jgi:translocation and assembly module TamB
MKKILNILLWILFALFFIVMGLLVTTQTSWFRSTVKNKALELANKNINGTLSLGELDGNFFTHLNLLNVTLLQENSDTLITIDEISLKYAPLRLFNNQIKIRSVLLDHPDIRLKRNDDSTWNFSKIMKQKETKEQEPTQPFDFVIILDQFLLQEGQLSVHSSDSLIPKSVEALNIDLMGRYASKDLSAQLNHLSFISHQPDFNLKSLQVKLQSDFEQWTVRDFKMVTRLNELFLDGKYTDLKDFNADLEWPAVHTEEFVFVLPDLKIPAHPELLFNVVSNDGQLDLDIQLTHNKESISLSGNIENFKELLSDSLRHTVPVNLILDVQNFNPNNWLETGHIPLLLNARLDIEGNGLKASSPKLVIKGSIRDSKWENHLIQKGDINASYLGGKTMADIRLNGEFGQLVTSAELNLNTPNGPFRAHVTTNNLAVHQILPEVLDSSIVNLSIRMDGRGLGTDNPQASFSGSLWESVAEHIPIDTLSLAGSYADKRLQLDTLNLSNQSMQAGLRGDYHLSDELSLRLQGDLFNTEAFEHYFSQPVDWKHLSFNAQAEGTTDSLALDFRTEMDSLTLDTTLTVNRILLSARGLLRNSRPEVNFNLKAESIEAADQSVDSLLVDGSLKDSLWQVDLDTYLPEELALFLTASGDFGAGITARLSRFDFNSPHANLQLSRDTAFITYSDSLISVKDFALEDQSDSLFVFNTEGLLQMPDSLRLLTDIQNFNLELLSQFGLTDQPLKGRASISLNMEGSKDDFVIDGNASMSEMEMKPFALSTISARFNYPGDSATIDVTVHNAEGDSININGITPLRMQLADSLLIHWPQTFRGHIKTTKTRLGGFFLESEGLDLPKALLTINMNMEGSVSNPTFKGSLDIEKGELPLPEYGVDYKDIRLKLSVDDTDVKLDSLFIRHLKGTFLAHGDMSMDTSLLKGKITSTHMTVKAKDFFVTRHRNYEVQIDADAFFKDEDNNPSFGGEVTVLRSSFNLPALLKMTEDQGKENEPLLVQSLKEGKIRKTDVESDTLRNMPELPNESPPMMEQLTGTIRLDVPRNTWIHSSDMQMELYGNVDVVKNSDVFELFGSLGIHRGFYTLYGKKLVIQEGELNFTGGETLNPSVNLEADYTFRDKERQKRVLTLSVGGTVKAPEISFVLDGTPLPEADAMSYLLFGQPFDNLNYGNQEGVSNAMPSRILTGLLSSQLSKTIGSTLNLDMIEIDAGDNWQNTTFMVGKYITNDLFVTYQRSFGQAENESITPETITLEYEITRRFFIRLIQGDVKESGLDVILKFEK